MPFLLYYVPYERSIILDKQSIMIYPACILSKNISFIHPLWRMNSRSLFTLPTKGGPFSPKSWIIFQMFPKHMYSKSHFVRKSKVFCKVGMAVLLSNSILYIIVLPFLLWLWKFIVEWSIIPKFFKILVPHSKFHKFLAEDGSKYIQKNDFWSQNVVKNSYLNEFTISLRNWSTSRNFCWKTQKNATSKNDL